MVNYVYVPQLLWVLFVAYAKIQNPYLTWNYYNNELIIFLVHAIPNIL